MQAPRPDLDTVFSVLTPREREIVSLIAAGRPNKVIAIDLGISLRTAEAHRARIFAKLDARNAMELACQLCAHGRSGASPILNARTPPIAVETISDAALAPHVLHEPAPTYGADPPAPKDSGLPNVEFGRPDGHGV